MSSQYPKLFNYDDAHAAQMVVRERCQKLLRVLHPDSTQGIATADLLTALKDILPDTVTHLPKIHETEGKRHSWFVRAPGETQWRGALYFMDQAPPASGDSSESDSERRRPRRRSRSRSRDRPLQRSIEAGIREIEALAAVMVHRERGAEDRSEVRRQNAADMKRVIQLFLERYGRCMSPSDSHDLRPGGSRWVTPYRAGFASVN